jgi:hypothetical protein
MHELLNATFVLLNDIQVGLSLFVHDFQIDFEFDEKNNNFGFILFRHIVFFI